MWLGACSDEMPRIDSQSLPERLVRRHQQKPGLYCHFVYAFYFVLFFQFVSDEIIVFFLFFFYFAHLVQNPFITLRSEYSSKAFSVKRDT